MHSHSPLAWTVQFPLLTNPNILKSWLKAMGLTYLVCMVILVPLFVGIPTLVLMVIKTSVALFKHFSASAPDVHFLGKAVSGEAQSKILNEIIWLCIFTVLIIFFGVIFGSVAFLLMYLRLHNKDSWLVSTVVCVTVVFATYFIFQEALKMQLYEGVFPGMISEWLDY